MYSTQGTEEKEFVSKYIEPGVHIVKIQSIEGIEADGTKKEYLQFIFINEEGMTSDQRFYMSQAAMPKSKEKIKHIATKIVKEATLDAVSAATLSEYGTALNTLLAGGKCRLKFNGEEVEGDNGNWWKAVIGLPTFAEAVSDGAEYEAVSEEKSKLKLNKSNKYDWAPLPVADGESQQGNVPAKEEDAVF